MALARSRHRGGVDYWPGFVDALSTLILGIIFLLTVFVVVQFVLSQEVTGKDTALQRLSARLSQLTELLSLEQTNKLSLEEQIAQLRASLSASEGERDRYKGLYQELGSGSATAQGKVTELSTQLDAEKRISLRALAQVEVLKNLVSEFSHFARLPKGARVPTDLNALVEEDYELARGLTETHLGFFMHRQAMASQQPEHFPPAYHDLAMAHHAAAEELARIIPTKDLKQILPLVIPLKRRHRRKLRIGKPDDDWLHNL